MSSPNLKSHAVSPLRFWTNTLPNTLNRKQCPPYVFSKMSSPNLKSQAVSPVRFWTNTLPYTYQILNRKQRPPQGFGQIHFPKSSIASNVPRKLFTNELPKSEIASSVPLQLLDKYTSQNPKSRAVSPFLDKYTSIHFPNLKSQAMSPFRFWTNTPSKVLNRKQCPY